MKLSQSLQQEGSSTTRPVAEIRCSPPGIGVKESNGPESELNARVVFIDVSGVDVARLCGDIAPGRCDVVVIDDPDRAVWSVTALPPDLVVCPWPTWCRLAGRIGEALSQARTCRPVLVLQIPMPNAAPNAEPGDPRSDAWTMHHQVRSSVRRIIRLVCETRGARPAATVARADITLDPVTRRVTRGGESLRLSQTTFQLLHILMTEPERVHSREELLRRLRGDQIHVAVRTIDVHIKRLRRELNVVGGPNVIQTIRGVGYAFGREPGWTD